MGFGQAEHHQAAGSGHTEETARNVGGDVLAERADDHHDEDDELRPGVGHEGAEVDEHPDADEEVGNKDGIADKLDAVHQRCAARDETVEDEACEEGAQDALQTSQFGGCCRQKHHADDEDVLHHTVAVGAEKPGDDAGKDDEEQGCEGRNLQQEKAPEKQVGRALQRARQSGQHQQCKQQRNHRRRHAHCDALVARQPVATHDGVTHQRVAGKDARQQQRRRHTESEPPESGRKAQHKGHERCHRTEDGALQLVLFQAGEVHLQTCQKHDVVDAHLAKEFERLVTLQQVKPVFTDKHTGQNHADEMWDAQTAEQHRCQQDDGQHDEEDPGVIGDGQRKVR